MCEPVKVVKRIGLPHLTGGVELALRGVQVSKTLLLCLSTVSVIPFVPLQTL